MDVENDNLWRLPNWEEYSESGFSEVSAWTDVDDEGECLKENVSPTASNANSTVVRRANMQSVTPTQQSRVPTVDFKALHLQYVQQRQKESSTLTESTQQLQTTKQRVQNNISNRLLDTSEIVSQQHAIAHELQNVREQLETFQHTWQSQVQNNSLNSDTPDNNPMSSRKFFDMSVQTEVDFREDAIQQWLHLITQKLGVFTSSFHHETTQLPLRYPLQTRLTGSQGISSSKSNESTTVALASWHVGSSLKALVHAPIGESLMELEQGITNLVLATTHTTQQYVEYFEKLIQQIQTQYQERFQQVVDESLVELKSQRLKYKKRVETLEAELKTMKENAGAWRLKETLTDHHIAMDKEKTLHQIESTKQQAELEMERLRQELMQVHEQLTIATIERTESDQRLRDLGKEKQDVDCSLQNLQSKLESVQQELQKANTQIHEAHSNFEHLEEDLCAKKRAIQEQQIHHKLKLESIHTEYRDQIEALEYSHEDQMKLRVNELERAHQLEVEAIQIEWQHRLKEVELKVPTPVDTMSSSVQTDDDDAFELLDEDTDARITRLQRRCRALEGLLDKTLDATSQCSPSPQLSLQNSRRSSMALSVALEDHLRERGTASSFSVSHELWETASCSSSAYSSSAYQYNHPVNSNPVELPPAPSPEKMLALVQKLEALAQHHQEELGSQQPEPEPEMDISPTTSKPRKMVAQTSSKQHGGRIKSRPLSGDPNKAKPIKSKSSSKSKATKPKSVKI